MIFFILACGFIDLLVFHTTQIPLIHVRYLPFFLALTVRPSALNLISSGLLISSINTLLHAKSPQELVVLVIFSILYAGVEYIFYPAAIQRVLCYFFLWTAFYNCFWMPSLFNMASSNCFSSPGFYGTLGLALVLTIIILQGEQDDR